MTWQPMIPYDDLWLHVDSNNMKMGYDIIKRLPSEKTKSGYINIWHFKNCPDNDTVLFCHGNAGNISQRSYIIDICYKFNLNLVLFDYRGFGRSCGYPNTKNIMTDGQLVYNYLRNQKISGDKIIVWGESLGGSVATNIAYNNPCKSLVLYSTFSSLSDVLRYHSDYSVKVRKMGAKVIEFCFDNLEIKHKLKNIKCPIVIIHSTEDELINYECARINFDKCKDALIVKIKGGHTSPEISVNDWLEIFTFLDHDVYSCQIEQIEYLSKRLTKVAGRDFEYLDTL